MATLATLTMTTRLHIYPTFYAFTTFFVNMCLIQPLTLFGKIILLLLFQDFQHYTQTILTTLVIKFLFNTNHIDILI